MMFNNPTTRILGLLAIAMFAVVGCSGGSSSDTELPIPIEPPEPESPFESRGLDGFTVIAFAETETTLVAGTEDGIYLYEEADVWTLKTPAEWSVIAMEALYPSHLMASVSSGSESLLVESLNGGEDWRIVDNNFGVIPGFEEREPIQSLLFRDDTGELFATGYGSLAVSEDFGGTWQVIDGEWGIIGTGFAALSLAPNLDDYWYGGQGALEDPILLAFSRSFMEHVDYSGEVEALLPRPSTVEQVTFSPNDDDLVFVMGEGGLIASPDYGGNWQALLVNDRSRFYFDLIIHESEGQMYTGGWDKNFTDPQPLVLEISDDNGQTWTDVEHDDTTLQGGIYSMVLWQHNNTERLFLGLQGGGVYEVDLTLLPSD